MKNFSLWQVCGIVMFPCLAVSAQGLQSQIPVTDSPSAGEPNNSAPVETPQTYIESTSPATFGATVITGPGERVLVGEVTDGSPADRLGLVSGDLVVSIDGQLITEPEQFNSYLASHPADRLRVIVLRDGEQLTLAQSETAESERTHAITDARPALGIQFLQAPQVILRHVLPGSPAEQAGLRSGDHLIAVNETTVASTDHFINLVAAAPLDAEMNLVVIRGRTRELITVTPEAWDVVFTPGDRYTTLKPAIGSSAPVVPAASYVGPAYYSSAVSPVGVPTIAFPTWYGFPYGYTAWAYPYYPYYPYYGGVYYHPNWYIHAWPGYYGPYPGYPGTRTKPENAESAQSKAEADHLTVESRADHPGFD